MKVVLISTDESSTGMGVKTLSACLLANGFETAVVLMASFEDDFNDFSWDDLAAICADAGLIGISCMTHGLPKAVETATALRGRVAAPVIVGGIHATLDPESLLRHFPLVCHGEGEDLVVELARRLDRGDRIDDIPGLWMARDGGAVRNPAAPLKKGIDDYPFPDYDISHQFVLEGNRLVPMRPAPPHVSLDDFVVLGSRGCPHRCTYCSNRKIKHDFPWRKRVAHYPIDYLIGNLEAARMAFPGVRSFWIEDDTFFAKSLEEITLFAGRYRREIGLPFQILISPWTYRKEKLTPLVEAGMTKLIMGIQSGSERVNREIYERHLTNERIMEIARSLHDFTELEKCYDFIGVNPFETAEDLGNTIAFIRSIPPPFFIFNNNLAFYPGTELHEKARAVGLDVGLRVKHAEPSVGYRILIREGLRHKLLHLLLLLMAGPVTRARIGTVPRALAGDRAVRLYLLVDRRFPGAANGVAATLAFVLYHCRWKKAVKRVIGARAAAWLVRIVHRSRTGRG